MREMSAKIIPHYHDVQQIHLNVIEANELWRGNWATVPNKFSHVLFSFLFLIKYCAPI
jgi:hypothetical protein